MIGAGIGCARGYCPAALIRYTNCVGGAIQPVIVPGLGFSATNELQLAVGADVPEIWDYSGMSKNLNPLARATTMIAPQMASAWALAGARLR
jgi:hypothetical protein